METCAYTRERKVERKREDSKERDGAVYAGKEGEVHVLERETRYTLDSDEAPFIRQGAEENRRNEADGREKKRGGNTGTRFGAQMIAKKEEREEPNETSTSVCVYVRIKDFSLSSSVSFFPPLSFRNFQRSPTYRREY